MASGLLEALLQAQTKPQDTGWGMATQGLASGIPAMVNPYDSAGKNAGMVLGGSLLAGLLGGLARSSAAEDNARLAMDFETLQQADPTAARAMIEQNNKYAPLYNALQADRYTRQQELATKELEAQLKNRYDLMLEEGKTPILSQRDQEKILLDAMAGQGKYRKPDGTIIDASKLGLMAPADFEADKARRIEEARRGIKGISPDDARKLEVDVTKQVLEGPAAMSLLNIKEKGDGVLKAILDPNPLKATTAIYKFAQTLDEKGVVRGEDGRMIADPGGPLGALAVVHNQLLQKGILTDDAISSLRELVPMLTENAYDKYSTQSNKLLEALARQQADPSNVPLLDRPVYPEELLRPMKAPIKAPDGRLIELVD
jgi:hypothetical protein